MRFSGDSLTDPEAGLLEEAAPPDFNHLFEETSDEDSGLPGGNYMSHRNLGSSPGASIDLSGKYCYKNDFICPLCSTFYPGNEALNLHIIWEHEFQQNHQPLKIRGRKTSRNPNEKKFHCELCDRWYFQKSSLIRHLRTHRTSEQSNHEYNTRQKRRK